MIQGLHPYLPHSVSSNAAGEKLWRMPMEESYWEQMKSPIADMKNTGGRMGGAITAALFLEKYVDTDKASSPGLKNTLGAHSMIVTLSL